jgi:hypothetical protein
MPYYKAALMETTKLTIRLPSEDVAFVKAYAKTHGLSVTQVIDRYLRRMRALDEKAPRPELDAITGLVPPDIDAEAEFRHHQLHKYSR